MDWSAWENFGASERQASLTPPTAEPSSDGVRWGVSESTTVAATTSRRVARTATARRVATAATPSPIRGRDAATLQAPQISTEQIRRQDAAALQAAFDAGVDDALARRPHARPSGEDIAQAYHQGYAEGAEITGVSVNSLGYYLRRS